MSKSIESRILVICAVAAAALMSVIKIGDYDIWWHLKMGELVLKNGAINQLDPFSFTTPGLPWPVHSWLAAVTYFKLYGAAGAAGLIVFNSFLFLIMLALIYFTMRLHEEHGAEAFFAALVIIMAAFALRFRMWVRPHVFEFVFLSAYVYILNLFKSGGKNRLYIIPFLQAVWVNTHGSQILGIIVPAIFLVGGAIQGIAFRDSLTVPPGKYLRYIGLVIVSTIAATLLNPDFYSALISPFTVLSPFLQNINEFQPLQWHHLWGYELRYTWGFAGLLALGVLGFLYRIRKIDFTDIFLFAAFFLMALRGIRFMAEFAIIASPIVFRNLSPLVYKVTRRAERPISIIGIIIILAIALPFSFSGKTYKFGLGVKEEIFPGKGVDFIEKAGLRGNILNSYGFGDYLIWREYPERKVFIHGHSRAEVFPQELYQSYLDAHTSAAVWKALTEKYNISYTLLEYYRTDYGGKETIAHLAEDPEWVPVYWDTLSLVYVKDVPENREILEKYGFRYIRPTYLDFAYLDRYVKTRAAQLPLAELDRLISISPENEEAYLARAYVHFYTGKNGYPAAIEDLKRAIAINPNQAMSHSALGMLYMRGGDLNGARAEYRATLAIDPGNETALNGLQELNSMQKR